MFYNTVVCRSFRQCARQSDTPYLCHFSTEMAEIWSPATSYQDVFAYKISALYHLYFQSNETFSGSHKIVLNTSTKSFVTLKVQVIES